MRPTMCLLLGAKSLSQSLIMLRSGLSLDQAVHHASLVVVVESEHLLQLGLVVHLGAAVLHPVLQHGLTLHLQSTINNDNDTDNDSDSEY